MKPLAKLLAARPPQVCFTTEGGELGLWQTPVPGHKPPPYGDAEAAAAAPVASSTPALGLGGAAAQAEVTPEVKAEVKAEVKTGAVASEDEAITAEDDSLVAEVGGAAAAAGGGRRRLRKVQHDSDDGGFSDHDDDEAP